MSEPVVRVTSLGKRFAVQRGWKDALRRPAARDMRIALHGVDLSVARGECFGVLGQNGAGKSTLFKILATLILPDEGSASISGFDVVRQPDEVRRVLIPVLAAERSLYWRVSAEENLRLYADLYRLPRAEARTRIGEVLEQVGLQDAGRKQVGLFSSGMKQRLLIARALLGRPDVLLLDEPTRSLDPISAREFRQFLREQVRRVHGTTILLATHDHQEVAELCDGVVVLDQGRVLAVGHTEQLLSSSRVRSCSIWTTQGHHPALEACVNAAGAAIVGVDDVTLNGDEAWQRVRIEVPTDEAGAAELLHAIVRAGITVSRFTRDDLSLADLLERVRAERGRREMEPA
ncbi:MAG TPA: ABC transporter ATP-binding protein [Longimicrobiales bacterium]|nr:ABC transporter ATP-binding protein [Longimicrobiales bacterium]